ncbi:WxL domain-containing protein [Enterococcus faecalis]|uniref:WxL domain-containing protein n=1 Tax=Enterococcus faecalis TaxID=1351 RepID=UPI003CC59A70
MKRLIGMSLITIALVTSLITGTKGIVLAEANDSAATQAIVTVNEGGGEDPDSPTPPLIEPSDPDDILVPPSSLGLQYASHFDFGRIKIGGAMIDQHPTNQVTTEDGKTVDVQYGVQVRDFRGNGLGWKIKVALSEFTGKDNRDNRLTGAELVLPAGKVKSSGTEVPAKEYPTAKAVKLAADGSISELFTAQEGQGMGIWANIWTKEQIHLKAPGNQYSGNYEATITWILQDTPA